MTLVRTADDLLTLLDGLLTGQDAERWDEFFADRVAVSGSCASGPRAAAG